jgi:two-component system sensor histidine kinase KdpD
VYPPERARLALQNFFREPTLVALRELAMRQTAQAVESRHPSDDSTIGGTANLAAFQVQERLLLLIEPHPASAALIRRGRRVADYLKAECLAVYVTKAPNLADLTPEQRETIDRQLNFARALQIETRILEGDDMAEALVNFARLNGVTQIFVMRHRERGVSAFLRRGLVLKIVSLARDMQVTVVADRSVGRASPAVSH